MKIMRSFNSLHLLIVLVATASIVCLFCCEISSNRNTTSDQAGGDSVISGNDDDGSYGIDDGSGARDEEENPTDNGIGGTDAGGCFSDNALCGDTNTCNNSTCVREISVSPSVLDFGIVDAGHAISQSISLRNIGGAPLKIFNIDFEKNTPAAFALKTPYQPTILHPGDEQNTEIVFSPVDAKPTTGTLEIFNDSSLPVVMVPLLANSCHGEADFAIVDEGEPPYKTIYPSSNDQSYSIDFGSIRLGTRATRKFQIINSGMCPSMLTIKNIYLSDLLDSGGGNFGLRITDAGDNLVLLPFHLNPSRWDSKERLVISITYEPANVGNSNASVIIETDDNDVNNDGKLDAGSTEVLLVGSAY